MSCAKSSHLLALTVAGVLAFGLCCVALTGCFQAIAAENGDASQNQVSEETSFISIAGMGASVKELEAKDEYLVFSSNPYSYISDGKNPYYNKIVGLGVKALPQLETVLRDTQNNGLEAYLIAAATEEVAGADVRAILGDDAVWTAKEFQKAWADIREGAAASVEAILASDELSADEKCARIDAYGALAVPQLMDSLAKGGMEEGLAEVMAQRVDAWALTEEEVAILRG